MSHKPREEPDADSLLFGGKDELLAFYQRDVYAMVMAMQDRLEEIATRLGQIEVELAKGKEGR